MYIQYPFPVQYKESVFTPQNFEFMFHFVPAFTLLLSSVPPTFSVFLRLRPRCSRSQERRFFYEGKKPFSPLDILCFWLGCPSGALHFIGETSSRTLRPSVSL